MYGRNHHNIEKQLSCNEKNINLKKNRKGLMDTQNNLTVTKQEMGGIN